jgi:hypothetical protein
MTVKPCLPFLLWLLEEWTIRFRQLDCDPRCFLVYPIDDLACHILVSNVAGEKQKAAQTVVNEALCCFEIDSLDGVGR